MGFNGFGQLGNGTTTCSPTPNAVLTLSSGVTALAGGAYHSLAVVNGNVYAWGDNNDGQLGNGTTTNSSLPLVVAPLTLRNITALAAIYYSSYALASDGSLWVWSDNYDGQLGLGTGAATDYITPQHLLPPSGFEYTALDGNADGYHVVAVLSAVVPEPCTWALLLAGGLGLATRAACRRRG